MSYCRWSSDDFQCDVYVYESLDGFVTHVAGNRVHWLKPLPPAPEPQRPDESDRVQEWMRWFRRHDDVMKMLDDPEAFERRDIGLPYDGEMFTDDTPGECADRLQGLALAGYNVPADVIATLRQEQEIEQQESV